MNDPINPLIKAIYHSGMSIRSLINSLPQKFNLKQVKQILDQFISDDKVKITIKFDYDRFLRKLNQLEKKTKIIRCPKHKEEAISAVCLYQDCPTTPLMCIQCSIQEHDTHRKQMVSLKNVSLMKLEQAFEALKTSVLQQLDKLKVSMFQDSKLSELMQSMQNKLNQSRRYKDIEDVAKDLRKIHALNQEESLVYQVQQIEKQITQIFQNKFTIPKVDQEKKNSINVYESIYLKVQSNGLINRDFDHNIIENKEFVSRLQNKHLVQYMSDVINSNKTNDSLHINLVSVSQSREWQSDKELFKHFIRDTIQDEAKLIQELQNYLFTRTMLMYQYAYDYMYTTFDPETLETMSQLLRETNQYLNKLPDQENIQAVKLQNLHLIKELHRDFGDNQLNQILDEWFAINLAKQSNLYAFIYNIQQKELIQRFKIIKNNYLLKKDFGIVGPIINSTIQYFNTFDQDQVLRELKKYGQNQVIFDQLNKLSSLMTQSELADQINSYGSFIQGKTSQIKFITQFSNNDIIILKELLQIMKQDENYLLHQLFIAVQEYFKSGTYLQIYEQLERISKSYLRESIIRQLKYKKFNPNENAHLIFQICIDLLEARVNVRPINQWISAEDQLRLNDFSNYICID